MKRIALSLLMVCALSTGAAAQCYVDYKAKKDDPLRLHYGVAQVNGACSTQNAQRQLSQRLQRNGWTLLNVMAVFGPEGLNERRNSAGSYYLRF